MNGIALALIIMALGMALVVYLECLADQHVSLRLCLWNMLIDYAARTGNDQLYIYAMRHRP